MRRSCYLYILQSEIDEMKAYTQEKEAEEASEEGSGEESSEETTEQEDKDTEKKKTIYDAFYELWRNAIISDTNEPGSTYKPFTVATGLESGALTGNESYFCTGSLMVGKRNIGCSHVHGNITLKDAVAKSCNVAMMNTALMKVQKHFIIIRIFLALDEAQELIFQARQKQRILYIMPRIIPIVSRLQRMLLVRTSTVR